MKKWLFLAAVVIIGIGVWWDNGLQGWMSVQTGTRCGSTGPHYCYWSGFGSVMPWVFFSMGGIFAGLAAALIAINCHEKGCLRIGKYPIAGGRFKYCGKHHPDWAGKHPPREHILHLHAEHRAQAGMPPPKGDHHDS